MTEKCFIDTADSKIKFREAGRQAVVLNASKELFTRVKVDGCLLKEVTAADWVLAKPSVGDVVIELKGTDIGRGIEQVRKTINHWNKAGLRAGRIAALIVCSRYPRIDTKIQRAKQALARDHRAPLHVVPRNREFEFEALLTYGGI